MRYLKKYRIFEYKTDKFLYHGSPYVFKEFKNRHTFFSESKKFSIEYGETKSFDQQLDREPSIYTVVAKCDFFNIHDKNDEKKIRNILPDDIEYAYNNFGFTTQTSKDDIIMNMKGFMRAPAYEPAVKAKVGDVIDGRDYIHDKYVVFKKDKKYAYVYDKKNFGYDYTPEKIMQSYDNVYKPVKDFIKNYVNLHKKNIDGYYNVHVEADIIRSFLNNKFNGYPEPGIEEKEEFNKLHKDMVDALLKVRIEKKYYKKYNIVDIDEKLIDTWRFYENSTVTDAIIKLGYGGYISQENREKTYVVFNPLEDVNIVKYEIPEGKEFDSWEDYKKFYEYDKVLAEHIKKLKSELKFKYFVIYNSWDVYKYYKDNRPIEDYIENVKKQIADRNIS